MGANVREMLRARLCAHVMKAGPEMAPNLPHAPALAENREKRRVSILPTAGAWED
jgi:hypothetical protein